MDSALLGSNEIDDILKFPEFSVSLKYLATGRWAYESASAYLRGCGGACIGPGPCQVTGGS